MINDTLNPAIFDNTDTGRRDAYMHPDVRERLLDIVDEFLLTLPEDSVPHIIDIILVGSNASYNYTPESDIDVHVVMNLEEISEDTPEIVGYLMNAYRQLFNKDYDITIRGNEVEVYVEDVNTSTVTNGMYSILMDTWLIYPDKDKIQDCQVDQADVDEWMISVTDALSDTNSSRIETFLDSLYMMRKMSLATDGECSKGNLIFKELRRRGCLDEIRDRLRKLKSKELSMEGLNIIEES